MSGAGARLGARVVVRVQERVPGTETVSVEVALHDQGRLFFLERIAHFAEEAGQQREEGRGSICLPRSTLRVPLTTLVSFSTAGNVGIAG